jgi:acetyltransferase-like isoleucine patch superfamily enzyme
MIKKIMKKLYFLFFSVYKYIKYPSCQIDTNFIMPTVKLGKKVIIRSGCKIQNNVSIGDFSSINENTQIDSNCKSIGKYCSISHGVKIGMGSHPLSHISTSTIFYEPYRGYVDNQLFDEFKDKGYTEIGNDVLIGTNAIILAGVKVGDGAVIAAGSVVTKNVEPYAIVGGNPAKIIKYRFDKQTIQDLLKIKWWDKDIKELISNINIMNNPQKFIQRNIKND